MLEHYEKFYLEDAASLEAECRRLGVELPVSETCDALKQSVDLGPAAAPNRIWLQPMEGMDAEPDGSPGPLTKRRYARYAEGGCGLLWLEASATALNTRAHETQLCLHAENAMAWSQWLTDLRRAALERGAGKVVVLLQLVDEPGPGSADTDPAALADRYVSATRLAAETGFDGVDIRCEQGDTLFCQMANSDGGVDGVVEILQQIRAENPGLILASRMNLFDAVSFGTDAEDPRKADPDNPIQCLQKMQEAGLSILNGSVNSPNLGNPSGASCRETDPPQEHPLTVLARRADLLRAVHRALPDLHLVAGGLSWLRHLIPQAGAGLVESGVTAIGLGRSALACPDAAHEMLKHGGLEPGRCCMVCYACSELRRRGGPVGCVIRDAGTYGPVYRNLWQFDEGRLREEASRCHDCEAAPCVAASPAGVDIPGMVKHFIAGRYDRAYDSLRAGNPLPEMTAHLCPSWMQAEGACVETVLTGRPVPIRDVQLTVSQHTRMQGRLGMRMPEALSGKTVAVVGGGPAGLAACIRLVEQGHRVQLMEQADRLGGMPELVIPSSRFPGAAAEIDGVLEPAVEAGRLEVCLGRSLGKHITLAELEKQVDAVLLAAGLWKDTGLEAGAGFVDALAFLREAKAGIQTSVPARVAVLSGGDSAMDAARTARRLGAEELYIVFEGPRAAMHWHMEESWFAGRGNHCLVLTRPLSGERDASGALVGLRIARMEPDGRTRVPGSESVLKVDLVLNAMGLQPEDGLRTGPDGGVLTFEAGSFTTGRDGVFACGALCNGGASIEQCVAEGTRAADATSRWLNKQQELLEE